MILKTGAYVSNTKIFNITRGSAIRPSDAKLLTKEELVEVMEIVERWREIRSQNDQEYAKLRYQELYGVGK
jgi:hypothetical protein